MSIAAETKSNEVTAETPTPLAPSSKFTPREVAVLQAQLTRRDAKAPCPTLKMDGHTVVVDHADARAGYAMLMEAFGTADAAFVSGILSDLANVTATPEDDDASERRLNFALSMVNAINPKDELETMLAAQMAVVHLATMRMANRLEHASSIPVLDSSERGLNKLARTFASQLEALKRYRTGGEQKVTVEHVHVHEGGQAIVGHVEHKGEGGAKINGSSPCANG
jgi:hypothetical protein